MACEAGAFVMTLGLCCCLLALVLGCAFAPIAIDVFFFFQAEDGIRVYKVAGVQTYALPICSVSPIACTCHWRRYSAKPMTASCKKCADRKSVVQGTSVDLGGRRIIKKN